LTVFSCRCSRGPERGSMVGPMCSRAAVAPHERRIPTPSSANPRTAVRPSWKCGRGSLDSWFCRTKGPSGLQGSPPALRDPPALRALGPASGQRLE